MDFFHKHHKIPIHFFRKIEWLGLDINQDDPINLESISIEEHANKHKILFHQYGYWEDELSWKTLSCQVTAKEATRLAIIKSNSTRVISEITRDKFRKAKLGWHPSKDAREKMSLKAKGRILSDKTKKKLSLSKLNNQHWLGKKHSEETKKKMSEKNKERWKIRKQSMECNHGFKAISLG